jgi:hypothetical protein
VQLTEGGLARMAWLESVSGAPGLHVYSLRCTLLSIHGLM